VQLGALKGGVSEFVAFALRNGMKGGEAKRGEVRRSKTSGRLAYDLSPPRALCLRAARVLVFPRPTGQL